MTLVSVYEDAINRVLTYPDSTTRTFSSQPSQKIDRKRDGSIVHSIRCPVTDNLIQWILQMGGDVKIIAPKTLKARVLEELKRMQALNK